MGTIFPDELKRRVEQFDRQSDQIRSPGYNEHLIRVDFIDPLMKELGWDMNNQQGFAEQYREVVHEDRVKVAGQTKAPDYSFRIGGQRKFFLEAKKPAVDIKNNWEPAYQLRRYAWSAKLAVSLLTDFEEFAIYDARLRPKEMEKPSIARREYLRYTEYESRWDFLHGTFSKDAVLRGDFDRYCDSKKGRGAELFDDAFLGEIEEWRKSLASNLARRNEALDEAGINFAVQRIIDRILFLRIAEDRGTEPVGQLQALLNGDNTYARLQKLFHEADVRYNSGLFHFVKEKDRDEAFDSITPTLEIDDKTLKTIVKGLYYPQSPYEFTMVSADILGSVYERFLGKVITLKGHTAKIEEKPEVRKAGGVYYTPVYIVDYIVKNTVGKLLGAASLSPSPGTPGEGEGGGEGLPAANAKTLTLLSPGVPGEGKTGRFKPSTLKILDPACGSGSFLIGAYQFLLDWYLDEYTLGERANGRTGERANGRTGERANGRTGERANGRTIAFSTGRNAPLRPTPIGGWALTIAERKRILIDHIHGVDLDSQAVEVTKLNLLLKCLEGETSQTLGFEQRLFRERALPDLGKNILCGNSLIGTEIVNSPVWEGMSEKERGEVKPFDYGSQFPQAFKGKSEGFDAVIGNPPYVLAQTLDNPAIFGLFANSFGVAKYKIDTYHLFLERAISVTKVGGTMGYIVPNTFIRNRHALELRRFILEKTNPRLLRLFDYNVFNASVDTAVIVVDRGKPVAHATVQLDRSATERDTTSKSGAVQAWREHPKLEFLSSDGASSDAIVTKIEAAGPALGAIATAYFGIQTFDRATYVSKKRLTASYRAVIDGGHIGRYSLAEHTEYVDFRPDAIKSGGKPAVYAQERIGVRQIGKVPVATLLPAGLPTLNTIYNIFFTCETTYSLRFVLGVMLSSTGRFFWSNRFFDQKKTFPKVKKPDLLAIPLATLDGKRTKLHVRLVSLVDTMLSLHKRLPAEALPQKREQLQREIDATDRQIDALVYQLYGLTEAEIRIVEEATA